MNKYKIINILILWIKDYLKTRKSAVFQIGSDCNTLQYIFINENTIICKKTGFSTMVFKNSNKKKIAKQILFDINKYEQECNQGSKQ